MDDRPRTAYRPAPWTSRGLSWRNAHRHDDWLTPRDLVPGGRIHTPPPIDGFWNPDRGVYLVADFRNDIVAEDLDGAGRRDEDEDHGVDRLIAAAFAICIAIAVSVGAAIAWAPL